MSSIIGKICTFVPILIAAAVAAYGEWDDQKQKKEIETMRQELDELKKEKDPETEDGLILTIYGDEEESV